ncbi:MAG: methyltransferase domain-containing protein [Planctomycetes bacterium]|nr:methyltransferase domain-containing protein [Planctomycetota bacterium]
MNTDTLEVRKPNTKSSDGGTAASLEDAIRERYAQGAAEVEPGLCCPTASYDPRYLKLLPREIIDKDYGCGDPSTHAREGDVVVDLGSGAGKVCYILAQKVGPAGRVIGLDFNDAMLSLARKYQNEMADKIGYANVEFRKARIQDMALDLDLASDYLAEQPITSVEQLDAYRACCDQLRRENPLVADESVDLIVSNCVLNLVTESEKAQLFQEMHRVLKPGGRTVISDIVCDEDPPPEVVNDADLWSGCIAGAFREDRFLQMFEEAGFFGVEILKRQDEPWQTIDGIEFRSMTVRAFKGKEGPCFERNQAVVYAGPWKQVHDDDDHVYFRGQRMAVCDKTYKLMTNPKGPYADQMIGIEPNEPVPADQALPFDCAAAAVRDPRQTKGRDYHVTKTNPSACCTGDNGSCC